MDQHAAAGFLSVRDQPLEADQRGTGAPILYLHGEAGPDRDAPFLQLLTASGRVVAPSHPGFGNSPLSASITGIDDLTYFYLDMIEQMGWTDLSIVGVGLGAWIALELATSGTNRIGRLALIDAVGVKISDRTTRDIADIFALTDEQIADLAWADPALGLPDLTTAPDQLLYDRARARETTARYAFTPYLHNPKLKRRLHRVRVPTLMLWGAQDRITLPAYGAAFAALIPGARFALIDNAGHYPQLEQPAVVARHVQDFLASSRS